MILAKRVPEAIGVIPPLLEGRARDAANILKLKFRPSFSLNRTNDIARIEIRAHLAV